MIEERKLYYELYLKLKDIETELSSTNATINNFFDDLKKVFSIEDEKIENEMLNIGKEELIRLEKELTQTILPDIQSKF